MRQILHEWKILDENLPETIFVRVYEERMDLLSAVIIGPAETPYHDGLFFFDIKFQNDYPVSPPKVHFRSGGYYLNPNLYAGGKVCLSLLNTWHGKNSERWNPKMSTILQVLVSIQGLVLNGKPYFNEPNILHKAFMKTEEEKSLSYNRKAFIQSCKLMMVFVRHPPKHFEEFVTQHFRERTSHPCCMQGLYERRNNWFFS
ncbi:hypothetical protein HPP92_005278 [Vanilla planifolia]|uniref:UBC core domain-containing protein n=1 Tax=Vanilla planifolia TaxID=51239 RepID=A0A835RPB5_VANPL|nr:hypothetical protein HPP92_005278 [Vanilla planifolia]